MSRPPSGASAIWPGVVADEQEFRAGDSVVVERLTGLTLSVRKAEDWELL